MNYIEYFDILKEQSDILYKEYQEALKVFYYLNEPINDDFCYALAIVTDYTNFKIVHKEEDGWQVIIANAIFAFGPSPKVKIIKENKL